MDRPQIGGAVDTAALNTLKWREIGPFRGGRSVAVAGSVARPERVLHGHDRRRRVQDAPTADSTWAPVTDKYFGGTIGAIAVSPSNPDIVYVGGGEYPTSAATSRTATACGRPPTPERPGRRSASRRRGRSRACACIRPIPTSCTSRALGHVFGADAGARRLSSTHRRRQDAGSKILFRNDSTGAIDLAMDPTNPNVLYAAFWQAGRTPWTLVSGGAGSGIFKTTDGGEHWTEITRNPGLPPGMIGNIGLAVSPANPNRVWAHHRGRFGRRLPLATTAGATWTRTNERPQAPPARVVLHAASSPTRRTRTCVYVLNVGFYRVDRRRQDLPRRSAAAARRQPRPVDRAERPAAHDRSERRRRDASSTDGGRSWTRAGLRDGAVLPRHHDQSLPVSRLRRAAGQQHALRAEPAGGRHRHRRLVRRGRRRERLHRGTRPTIPTSSTPAATAALLTRKDLRTGLERNINPWPDNPMGHSAIDLKYRFQWTFPIVLSPHDPNTLYATSAARHPHDRRRPELDR